MEKYKTSHVGPVSPGELGMFLNVDVGIFRVLKITLPYIVINLEGETHQESKFIPSSSQ